KSIREDSRPAASLRSKLRASTVGGLALSGMSIAVVTPPAASALVPRAKPSQWVRPGSSRCTWGSIPPARTCKPVASISSSAIPSTASAISTMTPSSTARSRTGAPGSVAIRPPRTMRSKPAMRLEKRVRLPGGAGRGCPGDRDGRLDEPVGPVLDAEDLVVVLEAEGREVDDEVVAVGHRHAHLDDLGSLGQHGLGHRVERLLER